MKEIMAMSREAQRVTEQGRGNSGISGLIQDYRLQGPCPERGLHLSMSGGLGEGELQSRETTGPRLYNREDEGR